VLALTYPEAVMLLEVVLVKMAIGLVTDITALIVLAVRYPEADIWLAVMTSPTVMLVKLKPLALTYPETDMLLADMVVKMPIGLVTDVTP